MDSRIENAVRLIVGLLVKGEYERIADITNNTRLRAEHIRGGIEEYPGTLIMPPDAAFANIDAIETIGPPPPQWSVRFDLWTREEGRSDLSAELTLIDSGDKSLEIHLDDIHVL